MISIISLNWNTTGMILRLYNSIKEHTSSNYGMIILDNGSNEDEYKVLEKQIDSNICLIREENNLGFAAGNNRSSKLVRKFYDNYVFFINSDIIIEEQDWDLKFIEVMEKDNVGIAGCAYHPLNWDKNGNFHIQPIPNEPVESESVQGAFFAIKGKLFKELLKNDKYIFDENFKYAHYEETDLCFRVRKMGYKIYWIPIKHTHDYNNSATKKNNFHLNDEIKNMNDFKMNSEKNKQLFIQKNKDLL